jgi:hypothetical protein
MLRQTRLRLKITILAAIIAGACSPGILAQTSARPDISGTWLDTSNGAIKWVFALKDDSMHVREMNGDRVVGDFTCVIDGQECAVKEDGRPVKVMLYYNGPAFIAIRERSGNDVTKERITLSPDGKILQVETVPLTDSQKPEKLTFERQPTTSESKS